MGADADGDSALPDGALQDTITLRLNEVDCRGRDWVEIVNLGDAPARLEGWRLTDDPADPGRAHPLEGELEAGGFAVVRQQIRREVGFTFGLRCGDDGVVLLDPEGEIADRVELPPIPRAWTYGRMPDGGAWQRTARTAGAPNRLPIDEAASLFDPMVAIPTIELTLPPPSIDALGAAPREYVAARFRLAPEGSRAARVRLKGRVGSFRSLDEKAAIKIRFDGEPFRGLERLTLNNLVQDRSMLHEWAAYSLFRELGVPAPRVGYVWLQINGADYGLYVNLETMDNAGLARWFQSTDTLYEGAYGQDLERGRVGDLEVDEGTDDQGAALLPLVDLIDTPPPEGLLEGGAERVDWDEALAMWAAEIYLGHWDGYAPSRNNYFIHLDDEGRASWLPWGTDQTFRRHLPLYEGRGRLFAACVADPACRTSYEAALVRVVEAVDRLALIPALRRLQARLAPLVAADPRRPYSAEAVAQAVDETVRFLEDRRGVLGEATACLVGPAPDPDGDGFACASDCDNSDPATFPGAVEICGDGIDQDCSGTPDDGFECPDCEPRLRGDHRYLFCPTPRTWAQAEAWCARYGSQLLTLDGPEESAWVLDRAPRIRGRGAWWMGLNDRAIEGDWRWIDDSAPGYQAWRPNEPNNAGDEDCAQLLPGGGWNDVSCAGSLSLICEDACEPGEDADGDGYLRCGADCDDRDPRVSPEAVEVCGDGIDQNCSGQPDDHPDCVCTEVVRVGSIDRSYLICDAPLSWAEARVICQERGGDLAILNDPDEAAWLYEAALAVRRQDYWIGLSDRMEEGAFAWVDGAPLGWAGWADGEPNNAGEEDCVHLWGASGLWNDMACGRPLAFLCEAPAE